MKIIKVLQILLVGAECSFACVSGDGFCLDETVEASILRDNERVSLRVDGIFAFENDRARYLVLDVVVGTRRGFEGSWIGRLIVRREKEAKDWLHAPIFYFIGDESSRSLIHMMDEEICEKYLKDAFLWNHDDVDRIPSKR